MQHYSQIKTLSENVSRDFLDAGVRPIGDLKKSGVHGPAAHQWRSLIERYIQGEVCIHIHLASPDRLVGVDAASHEYCIVLKCPRLPLLRNHTTVSKDRWEREFKRRQRRAGQMDRAVLVEVGQLVQMRKWASVALPCIEWLHRPNQGCCFLANSGKHLGAVPSKFRGNPKDRELGPAIQNRSRTPVMNDQFINRVIQCRTEIVKNLPNNDAPHGWTWFFHDHANGKLQAAALPSFLVELDRWYIRIRIKKDSHFVPKKLDVVVGALEF